MDLLPQQLPPRSPHVPAASVAMSAVLGGALAVPRTPQTAAGAAGAAGADAASRAGAVAGVGSSPVLMRTVSAPPLSMTPSAAAAAALTSPLSGDRPRASRLRNTFIFSDMFLSFRSNLPVALYMSACLCLYIMVCVAVNRTAPEYRYLILAELYPNASTDYASMLDAAAKADPLYVLLSRSVLSFRFEISLKTTTPAANSLKVNFVLIFAVFVARCCPPFCKSIGFWSDTRKKVPS